MRSRSRGAWFMGSLRDAIFRDGTFDRACALARSWHLSVMAIRKRYRWQGMAASDPKRTSRWNIAHHFVPRITQAAKPDRMTS